MARHPSVILAPRELKAWIGTLPLANPPRSAGMLLQQLRLLVRDPQPGARLGQLLELYEPTIDALLAVVGERLQTNTDSAIPLDQLEYQLVELLTELAAGHLRIANDLLHAGKAPTVDTLYRAMRLLDDALGIERLHYHRLSPERWRALLSIYLRAAHLQVSEQRVRLPGSEPPRPDTIRGLFFRALLISLCDPHHHRPGEVLAWMRWTAGHVDMLDLTLLPQGAFAIPLDVSGALPPLASARRGKPGPDTRYLATDAFLQCARDEADDAGGLYAVLVDLIRGRKVADQRQSPRQPRNHPYRLFYGLRSIHRRLGELTQGRHDSETLLSAIPGRQVNQSRAGAAFHIQGPLNPPLTVGEVFLAEAEGSGAGSAPVGFAARLQRLVSGDRQQVEIGVEKLSGRLIPVTVSGPATERGRIDPHALLQQDIDTGRYTLLAARGLYRENDTVTVEGPNARYRLRMTGLDSVVQHTAQIAVEVSDD